MTKKLQIVVDGITYYREPPALEKAKQAIDKWEWVCSRIRSDADAAQELYDNMRDEGLQVGMIEAEGYLRCAKTMVHLVDQINEAIDAED